MIQSDSIEEMLQPGETILWEDRAGGVGTRSLGATLWRQTFEGWGLLIVLLIHGVGAVVVSRHLPFEGMFIVGLMGMALLGLSAFIARGMWKERRFFQTASLSYVLTSQRLVACNQADQWSAQVFPGGLSGLARTGRNLELYLKEPNEPLTLYDLEDAKSAEAIIAKTLGPLS